MKNPNLMSAFLMMVKLLGGGYFICYGVWMLITHEFSWAFPAMIALGAAFWYFAWADPERDALWKQLMSRPASHRSADQPTDQADAKATEHKEPHSADQSDTLAAHTPTDSPAHAPVDTSADNDDTQPTR